MSPSDRRNIRRGTVGIRPTSWPDYRSPASSGQCPSFRYILRPWQNNFDIGGKYSEQFGAAAPGVMVNAMAAIRQRGSASFNDLFDAVVEEPYRHEPMVHVVSKMVGRLQEDGLVRQRIPYKLTSLARALVNSRAGTTVYAPPEPSYSLTRQGSAALNAHGSLISKSQREILSCSVDSQPLRATLYFCPKWRNRRSRLRKSVNKKIWLGRKCRFRHIVAGIDLGCRKT